VAPTRPVAAARASAPTAGVRWEQGEGHAALVRY
jgi:hypothetical protein